MVEQAGTTAEGWRKLGLSPPPQAWSENNGSGEKGAWQRKKARGGGTHTLPSCFCWSPVVWTALGQLCSLHSPGEAQELLGSSAKRVEGCSPTAGHAAVLLEGQWAKAQGNPTQAAAGKGGWGTGNQLKQRLHSPE